MKKVSRNLFLLATIFLGVVYNVPSQTSANYITTGTYNMRDYAPTSGTLKGGYFESYYGQENLRSNGISTHNESFITKEMWFNFSALEWIEIGDVDGSVN